MVHIRQALFQQHSYNIMCPKMGYYPLTFRILANQLCQTTVSCVSLVLLLQFSNIDNSYFMSIIFMERRRLFKNLPVTHFKHLSISTLFITETYTVSFLVFFRRYRNYSPKMSKSTRSAKKEDVRCFDVKGQEEGGIQFRGLSSHQRQNQDLSRGAGSSGIIPQYPLL